MRIFSQNVVLGTETLQVAPAAIEIQGGHIVNVDEVSVCPDGAEDLGQLLVSPAFVNAHTHLAMSFLRGAIPRETFSGNVVEDVFYKHESSLTAEEVRVFTRMGAYEVLLSGTASVWDHYYYGEAVAQGMGDVGLAGVVAPTLQDVSGPGKEQVEMQLSVTEAMAEDVTLAKQGIFAAVGAHASDTVSDHLWKQIMELCQRRELPLHSHISQTAEEMHRSFDEHGTSPLVHLARLGVLDAIPHGLWVHGLYVSQEEMGHLASASSTLGVCPSSQKQFGFVANMPAYQTAGVPMAMGTDCAASSDGMNVQRELGEWTTQVTSGIWNETRGVLNGATSTSVNELNAARGQRWDSMSTYADPQTILQSVWGVPGGMHPRFRCGVIEPGALAHLTVWDLSHPNMWPGTDPIRALAYNNPAPAIWNMMVAGKWRGSSGDYHRSIVNSDEYRTACQEASAAVSARFA